ncbi:hypothetical protein FRC11_013385 [Ceratobasidium sp. 423]|nr:hypothetical protein FRC11_013385 [Ceratobasidium sp. 423]
MSQLPLEKYLFLGYVNARSNKPNAGRRHLKLKVVEQFWTLDKTQKGEQIKNAAKIEEPTSFDPGSDPYDIPNLKDSRVVGTRGIIVRTHLDPNDEPAWNAFLATLERLERESLADISNVQMESDGDSEDEEADQNEDDEMAEAGPPPITYESDAIFTVIDPVKQGTYYALQVRLSNASNIALLRLFNDVSIAPSLSPPDDMPKRIKPGHRLIDEDGFQVHLADRGRIWVWDQQSAKDQTLRLVSPQVSVYGDATGDSWRVKVAHIWELQLHLDSGYEVYLKMENLQLSQSFKYRGISLFVSRAVKEHGPEVRIVAATSGNAGIALAWVGKYLNVRTSVFIPTSAISVQAELEMAGAEVVVGGTDYADALLAAQAFCETEPRTILMSSYDHPTLWEGHSTMIYEIACQLPNKIIPDAIVCNVGGGGLLGGILRGVNELKWDPTKLIAIETHGANCYHLSLLANSLDPAARSLIPDYVSLFKSPTLAGEIPQAEVTLVKLPVITSEASSLGARSPSQMTLEIGLARSGLTAANEQKLLVELACGATLSPAYTPGLLDKLVPKASEKHRPVIVFIICGGSKAAFQDAQRYRNIIWKNAEMDRSLQPSQSFKYRGISLFAARAVKKHGPNVLLVMASGGNAGLALAWAGKALGVRTKIYIPSAAYEVQPTLAAAGADVVIGGNDYSEALASAEQLCSQDDHAVLIPAYDHPTLWEGHSTLIYEVERQLPNRIKPDAILCSVGGAGLLGGVLCGVNNVGWEHTQVIALETIGANCHHLSLLANTKDAIGQRYIPDDVAVSTHPALIPDVKRSEVTIAKFPAITSKAASLGASSPSQSVLEMGLARRDRATQNPTVFGGLTPVSIPDELAIRSTLGFLDEHKMLTELACATTLAPAYIPGLLEDLVPKSGDKRPVVVFVVCGGSKILLSDVEKYRTIVQASGEDGFRAACQQVLIDTTLGLNI